MNTMLRSWHEFLEGEDGPTAVEYAMMLALIIVVCIAILGTLGHNMHQTFDRVWDGIRGHG